MAQISSSKRKGTAGPRWTAQLHKESVAAVKGHLVALSDGSTERLSFILRRAVALKSAADESGAEHRLEQILYCMHALMHHARYGGLTQSQVEQLRALVFTILRLEGIDFQRSHFSFFYGDLHAVVGQIFRRQGAHWQAAWNQFMACRLGTPPSEENKGYHYFVSGNRMFRLGDFATARSNYDTAVSEGLELAFHLEVLLLRCRLARIAGDKAGAVATLRQVEDRRFDSVRDRFTQDMDFERFMLEVTGEDAGKALLDAIIPRQPRFTAGNALEIMLHVLALPSSKGCQRLAEMMTRTFQSALKIPKGDPAFALVAALTTSYRDGIGPHSIQPVGEELEKVGTYGAIVHEMLAWVAVGRMIHRVRFHDTSLSQFCFNRYKVISMQVSDGMRTDCIGLMSAGDDVT